MKRKLIAMIAIFLAVFTLSAATFHSVPLDNEAYRIIDIAELRGIISTQVDVRPYNLDKVYSLLGEIKASTLVSESEKAEIDRVISDLEFSYGYSDTKTISDVLADGNVSVNGNNPMKIGGKVETIQTVGYKTEGEKVFDSRNGVTAFVMGDLLGVLSYDLNFRLNIDKIDSSAFLPTELKFSTDGFYLNLLESGNRLTELPDGRFFLGLEAFPEMSTNIMDVVSIRFGAVERDWGPGKGNIALSSSARTMDGLELSITPTSWFSYSVMNASLGLGSLKEVNGIPWPSENMDEKNGEYSNNLSIHRLELGPIKGVKFSVWESVVWRKRFELSYLNPLCIYMFTQNSLGDYDNVLAGFDLSFTLPGFGSFYAAIAMDELNSVKRPFSCPRNILAYQAGMKFSVPLLDFSVVQLQATYIPAFFGAHYATTAKIFGNVYYTTAYVNKGQNIGYPVNPDTLELLLSFDTTAFDGWKLGLLVKDQLRSAQYAEKAYGTNILTSIDYPRYDNGPGEWGYYESRDFFGNIWNNILDVELSAEKGFESVPISLFFGLQGMLESKRDFTSKTIAFGTTDLLYPGKIESWGEWENELTVNAKIGIKVYY